MSARRKAEDLGAVLLFAIALGFLVAGAAEAIVYLMGCFR